MQQTRAGPQLRVKAIHCGGAKPQCQPGGQRGGRVGDTGGGHRLLLLSFAGVPDVQSKHNLKDAAEHTSHPFTRDVCVYCVAPLAQGEHRAWALLFQRSRLLPGLPVTWRPGTHVHALWCGAVLDNRRGRGQSAVRGALGRHVYVFWAGRDVCLLGPGSQTHGRRQHLCRSRRTGVPHRGLRTLKTLASQLLPIKNADPHGGPLCSCSIDALVFHGAS